MKTFKIYTLGCKVNQYESQAIRESLFASGLAEQDKNLKSDTYVVNTCTVTSRADKDSLYFINRAFKENPKAEIVVTGCLAEQDKDKIINKFGGRLKIIAKKDICKDIGISNFKGHDRAFLKIQDGCNNFCSYCKVPLVRGRSKSRSLDSVFEEAKRLTNNGFKEIVLTGICLGSYGKDLSKKIDLCDVLKSLSKINNIGRVRLSSIEAKDVNKELILAIRDLSFVCKHLHLPLQSGDDAILKRMNRPYLTKDYLKLVNMLKKEIPQISITTDVIVGFPGEENENFKNTIKTLKKIKPSRMHIFSYSDRPGTKSFEFYPKVAQSIVKKRFLELNKIAREFSFDYRSKFLNKDVEVLVENMLDKDTGLQTGYTDTYIKVCINSKKNFKGRLVNFKVNSVTKDNTYVK